MTAVARSQAGVEALLRSWLADVGAPEIDAVTQSSSARIPLPRWFGQEGREAPGAYPFTRGRTALGYAEKLWVMGQYSGFATPSETKERFQRLLDAGQTGLSIALDLPTQMGLDSDAPLSDGEVGKVGVPLDTVDDLVTLLDGLPLERVRQMRTSANAIGPIFAALMVVALEEIGADPDGFRLMLQNDPLKEFSARGTYIVPPAPSVKLAVDVIEYFANELPHWEPIEFCGYHIRDAGGTAVQEVAIATANGIEYLDSAVARGVRVETFVEQLFLFFSTSTDVFEETAKLRAARRIWARLLHERYGVPESRAGINVFVYTLGGALTAQQPLNNVVRVTLEALAAVLGGAQTIATSSYDEALGLPSLEAARLALRTQQVLAHESGATTVVDPLGGSYYVEELTNRLETAVLEHLLSIVERGGAVGALESGVIQAELADSAYAAQRELEDGVRPVVGVNLFTEDAAVSVNSFAVPPELQAEQVASLERVRATRDTHRVGQALARVTADARGGANSIPSLIEAARMRATLGEMVDALAAVYGRQTERNA